MHEKHIAGEVARRAQVEEKDAHSMLSALKGLVQEGQIGSDQFRSVANRAVAGLSPTDPRLVDELIEKAKKHPLGTEFLELGSLDSVAAGLGAHAFTVEAARERLRSGGSAE